MIDIALRALERFLPTTYFPAHSADLLQGLRSRMMDGHAAGDDTLARLKDGVVERDGIVERCPVDGRKLAAASVR